MNGVTVQPPAIIDTGQLVQAVATAGNHGPVLVNGALWVIGIQQIGNPPYFVAVYKSTDNGLTWTIQDSANSPNAANVTVMTAFDGVDQLYACRFTFNGQTFSVDKFNINTATWSSYTSSSAAVTGCIGLSLAAYGSTGDLMVLYYKFSTGTLRFMQYVSGSWGTEVNQGGIPNSTGNANWFASIAIDTSDRAHVGLYVRKIGVNDDIRLHYFQTDKAGVSSATQQINQLITSNWPSTSAFDADKIIYRSQSDEVIITWNTPSSHFCSTGTGDSMFGVYRGTPASNPTFTFEQIYQGGILGTNEWGCFTTLCMSQTDDYTDIYAVARTGSSVCIGYGFVAWWKWDHNTSTWSAPAILFSEATYPPVLPLGTVSDGTAHISAVIYDATKEIGVYIGMFVQDPSDPSQFICNVLAYLDGATVASQPRNRIIYGTFASDRAGGNRMYIGRERLRAPAGLLSAPQPAGLAGSVVSIG